MVTAGKGWYQERGKEARLLHKGDVVEISPNVEHWHGATHDSAFEHIAIGTKTHSGAAVWLEPVTDEKYNSLKNEIRIAIPQEQALSGLNKNGSNLIP